MLSIRDGSCWIEAEGDFNVIKRYLEAWHFENDFRIFDKVFLPNDATINVLAGILNTCRFCCESVKECDLGYLTDLMRLHVKHER